MRFGKIGVVLSLFLAVLCVTNVNAQSGCNGVASSCSGVASSCSGAASVQSVRYGLFRKIASRVSRPVVNTLSYVVQNRPRPVARFVDYVQSANLVQVAVTPVVSVLSTNCGCPNCTCGENCNCSVENSSVQVTPVLRTREVVYNCDACGQVHVAAVKNIMTVVPRTLQNVRAVRQANVTTSNLFFVPDEQSSVESVPSSVSERDIANVDSADLVLMSI